MKTLTIIALSFTLFFYGCSKTNNEKVANDLKKDNLFGQVKSVKRNTHLAIDVFGVIKKGGKDNNLFLFEEFVRWKDYEWDDYVIYNKSGNIIKSFLGDTVCFSGKLIIEYDSCGRKSKSLRYYDNDSLNVLNYKYNKADRIIEEAHYFSNGNIEFKRIFEYDKTNNIIREQKYDSKGDLKKEILYKYDSEGIISENIVFNSKGIIDRKTSYRYDDNNNVMEKSLGDSKYTYKYDDYGNVIEKDHYSTDNNIISKFTYEYKFDSQDNWVERIEFKNYYPKRIIERRIEYYD